MRVLSQAVFSTSLKSLQSSPAERQKRLTKTDRQAHEFFLHNPLSTAGTHRRYPTELIHCKQTAVCPLPLLCASSFCTSLSRFGPFEDPCCFPLRPFLFHRGHFSSFHLHLLSLSWVFILLSHPHNTDATATVIIILWAACWTPAKCTLHAPAVPQRLHTHTNTLPCTQISIKNNERL